MNNESAQNQLECDLSRLGRLIEPPVGFVDQVMSGIRWLPHEKRSHAFYKRYWRWSLTAAACALIVTASWLLYVTSSQVRAADQLQRAIKITSDYKGWIHIRYEIFPASQPTTDHASPIVPHITVAHLDTQNDTSIDIRGEGEGQREVEMHVPSQKLWYIYDPRVNELRISQTNEFLASDFAREVSAQPVAASELLAQWEVGLATPAHVTITREGGLTRFDLSDNRKGSDGQGTVWVDQQTNQICKISRQTSQGEVVSEYTYGLPEFQTIFDAGVPLNAKVVDSRPSPDVQLVLARLHERLLRGYGDCVAIRTDGKFFKGKTMGDGDMTILAREGDKMLSAARYAVLDLSSSGVKVIGKESRGMTHPAHWPLPSLDDALAAVKNAIPIEVHIINRDQQWQGGTSRDLNHFWIDPAMPLPPVKQAVYFYSVGASIWPKDVEMGTNVPGSKVELLADAQRPGLIGLQCDDGPDPDSHRNIIPRERRIFWIDPKRDDMPVETFEIENPPKDGLGDSYVHTTFSAYAQLADGYWYPSRWERTNSKSTSSMVTNLQIFPGGKLSADWYTDPAKRFGEKESRP